ncbi:MAG: hypothetical protein JWM53_5119 [bacterium]|nr:hypothetical protein [bacterium]
MKRDRSLVVLGVIAVGVAALIVWDRQRPSTEEATRERQHLLPGFERARATEIEIERPTPPTKLRHETSGWWIEGPPRVRADDTAVESLLSVLEYGQVERRIPTVDAKLRRTLGVDVPRAIVRVGGHTLRIGGDDPSRGVYVERDGEAGVVVAEHRLIETAGIAPELWRSTRLTLADPAQAKKIATDGWTLERGRGWRLTRPIVARASDAKVDALVQALERARGLPDERPLGTIGSGESLALDGVEQARLIGACPSGAANQLLAIRADRAALCFRATDLNLVRTPLATYYERRLFPLRLDDIVAVDVGPLKLRREAGAWRIIAPLAAVRPVDDTKVRAFLEPLLAAEARSFSPAPPAAAATRVRLATADDEVIATVDGARARRDGETITLELAAPLALATSF